MELVGISDSASDLIDGITGPAKQFRGFDHTIADQEFLGRFSHGFLEYFAKITPVETGTLRDALDGDAGSRRNTQRKVTVHVGGSSDAGVADHRDSSADDRLSGRVDDLAANVAILGIGTQAHEQSAEHQDGAFCSLQRFFQHFSEF